MIRYDYGWEIMMYAKVKCFLLTATLFAAMPAARAQTHRGKALSATLQGKWYLMPVLSSDTATGKIPEISFDAASGHFTGNTGCNNMRGSFHRSDSTLTISEQIVTTRMMCVGYNEPAFLKNLIRVNGYKIQNGMLILMVDGAEVSRWNRRIVRAARVLST